MTAGVAQRVSGPLAGQSSSGRGRAVATPACVMVPRVVFLATSFSLLLFGMLMIFPARVSAPNNTTRHVAPPVRVAKRSAPWKNLLAFLYCPFAALAATSFDTATGSEYDDMMSIMEYI